MAGSEPPISTEHGFRAYLPHPRERREGVALCLSGGGYRAALFHLGGLRRLNELGVLSSIETFTSVSGGSIMLAQLASHRAALGDRWPQPGRPVPRFEEGVADPMRRFARTDIRTGSALRVLHPAHWRNQNAGVDALAEHYARGPAPGRLADLPERPRFVFCATDLLFRTQWVFDAGWRRVGSDQAGYAPLSDRWSLARAVAASSCLSPVYKPMRLGDLAGDLRPGEYTGPDRDRIVRSIELTDGGMHDNLGLEPVWRDHRDVLVSDAAPSLTPVPPFGAIWRSLRLVVALLEQATDVRKRWLIASFLERELRGAYWGIGSFPSSYPAPRDGDPAVEAYDDELVSEHISQVRIDLDVFSDGEIGVLENHGYLMAEIAVRRHAPHLIAADSPPPVVPWPEWMEERRAREALEHSDETKLFPRLRLGARLALGRV
jgi:NTE family protein